MDRETTSGKGMTEDTAGGGSRGETSVRDQRVSSGERGGDRYRMEESAFWKVIMISGAGGYASPGKTGGNNRRHL